MDRTIALAEIACAARLAHGVVAVEALGLNAQGLFLFIDAVNPKIFAIRDHFRDIEDPEIDELLARYFEFNHALWLHCEVQTA